MKRIVVVLFIFVVAYAVTLVAQDSTTEFINMKEKYDPSGNYADAMFPHWLHEKTLNCADCHVNGVELKDQLNDTKLDTSGPSIAAFHDHYCLACHDKEGTPISAPRIKDCNVCHTGP